MKMKLEDYKDYIKEENKEFTLYYFPIEIPEGFQNIILNLMDSGEYVGMERIYDENYDDRLYPGMMPEPEPKMVTHGFNVKIMIHNKNKK